MTNKTYDSLALLLSTDAYKLGHKDQYPKGVEILYSNLTPRKSKDDKIKQVYVHGLKDAVLDMYQEWDKHFFSLTKVEIALVLEEYQKIVMRIMNIETYDISHFEDLWKVNKLSNAIKVKVIKDETLLDFNIPILKIWNIDKKFYWLVNYLETSILANVWHLITNATKAYELKKLLEEYADKTADDNGFVKYQAHDFSARGISTSSAVGSLGQGHLFSFEGSDSLAAILKYNLQPNRDKKPQWKGSSVFATEHSVMMSATREEEFDFIKQIINQFGSGIGAIVCDTYDYYNVINNYLPKLKEDILKRDGKIVIRPDSGDEVKITLDSLEKFWEIFSGTINKKGYKVLDPHIGLIYGDGFNQEKINNILIAMEQNGFSSENIVFGIGANVYQNSTRDLFGFSMKITYIEINSKPKLLCKEPMTGMNKKSAKGLLAVKAGKLIQCVSWEESDNDDMIFV